MLLLSVGITTGYAQSAIVGTYNGDLDQEHLDGNISSDPDQQLIISEGENGTINVIFPTIAILGQFQTGEITIEDVTATAKDNGSYSLTKEQFTVTVTSGMSVSYGYCSLSGTITATGEANIALSIKQNPSMTLTTATFYGDIPDHVSPIVAAYGGSLSSKQMTGTESTEAEKVAIIAKATAFTANITFPSVAVLGQFNTGDFTIEGVNVTPQDDGSYLLSKEQFTISVTAASGMTMSYGYSTLAGTVSAEGDIEITVEVKQNPTMALTTATFTGKPLDSSTFVWGKASWNIADGTVYDSVEEFENAGLTLSYPNPTGYNLTFLNIISVACNIYMDDNEEPIEYNANAQGDTQAKVSYTFSEGHSYRIVTTGAVLVQANLATRKTDTLSVNTDSYAISFRINGPELQKTIETEAYMSLCIVDQNTKPTASEIDVTEILSALGIDDISEATFHALNRDGSYNDHMDYFDFWRDADGEFTTYYGGYNSVAGHNAYPAVYCIKINEAADSITYYFYDYWTVYDPDEEGFVPGTGSEIQTSKRATPPTTSYNSVIWDWDNGDGTTTQYRRNYRMDEGKDYEAGFIFVANRKSVIIRATLHFVSQEEYEEATGIAEAKSGETAKASSGRTEYYSVNGTRIGSLQKGINIVREADGTVRKVIVR